MFLHILDIIHHSAIYAHIISEQVEASPGRINESKKICHENSFQASEMTGWNLSLEFTVT